MNEKDFLSKQLEMLRNLKSGDGDYSWKDINNFRTTFGKPPVHDDTIRKGDFLRLEYDLAGWIRPPEVEGEIDVSKVKSSVEYKENGNVTYDKLIEICENEEMTPEFLMKAHGLDSNKWQVLSYKNNYWHSQVRGGKRLLMYQSKVTVKPRKDDITFEQIEEWFKTFEPKPLPKREYVSNYGVGENCLVIPIVDLHYNMLATTLVTGNEYNCNIAEENFYKILKDIIGRVKDKNIHKILFPIGNDLFNSNGIKGETFKGTRQDEDSHIFDAYIKLFEIMVNGIEMLALVAPVDIIYIPSNHDKEVTFYFMHNLHTQYRNDEKVNVDYSPLPRKYYKFGNTLFVFSHNVKLDSIARTVLDEGKEYLNGVEYIEVMLAHLHSETVKQDKNITLRRLPTTSEGSAWSNDSNYGSKKVHLSFIFNDKNSVTDVLYSMV